MTERPSSPGGATHGIHAEPEGERVHVPPRRQRMQPAGEASQPSTHDGVSDPKTARRAATKPIKAKRVPPEGAILPDRGWPKWHYMFNKLFRRPDLVPSINRAQQEFMYHQALENWKQTLIERLRQLSNLGIAPIMDFENIKSAGKSTAAVFVGNLVAFHTQKPTLLLPATQNNATATAGQFAGAVGKAITVSQFSRTLKEFGTARALNKNVPRTKWGLGVIIEDKNSAANEDDAGSTKDFMDMVDVLLPHLNCLILDGGNDNISKRSIPLQAARLSHVIDMPVKMDESPSETTLRGTLTGLWSDTGIPADIEDEYYTGFQSKDESGWKIATRSKIENAIVIATKADRDEDVDFSEMMLAEQDANAEDLPKWHGTGICVPADPSIGRKDKRRKLVPYDLESLKLETYVSYLEIAVANFEMAGHQIGIDIGTPLVAKLAT